MASSHDKALKVSKAKETGQALKKHINTYHEKGQTSLDFRSSRKMMKHYNKAER